MSSVGNIYKQSLLAHFYVIHLEMKTVILAIIQLCCKEIIWFEYLYCSLFQRILYFNCWRKKVAPKYIHRNLDMHVRMQ